MLNMGRHYGTLYDEDIYFDYHAVHILYDFVFGKTQIGTHCQWSVIGNFFNDVSCRQHFRREPQYYGD